MAARVNSVGASWAAALGNSSKSNRLREVAAHRGVPAYMVDRADQLDPGWVSGKTRVGVTAGASAPEVLVREVLARLKALGAGSVRELAGAREHVVFPMPKAVEMTSYVVYIGFDPVSAQQMDRTKKPAPRPAKPPKRQMSQVSPG